jgi:hypothetical protein
MSLAVRRGAPPGRRCRPLDAQARQPHRVEQRRPLWPVRPSLCCGSGYVIAASSAELIRPQLGRTDPPSARQN